MKKLLVFDLDGTLFDTDGQLNGSYENIRLITPFEGILDILTIPDAINILVTAGNLDIQFQKIRALGIEAYFSEVHVPPKRKNKRDFFILLAEKYRAKVRDMFVIGDRIDCEILYGNELGFKTILVAQGKHRLLVPKNPGVKPAFTVETCKELLPILCS